MKKSTLLALVSGLLFGAGISLANLFDPAVILGAMDPFSFDPTLHIALVCSALVYAAIRHFAHRRATPLLAAVYLQPSSSAITPRLVIGASIFGAGWGLAGMCPGAAVTALGTGSASVLIYFAALLLGLVAGGLLVGAGADALRQTAPA